MKIKLIFCALIVAISIAAFATIRYFEKYHTMFKGEKPNQEVSPIINTASVTFSYPEGIKEDLMRINQEASKLNNVKITSAYSITTTYEDNHQEFSDFQYSMMRKDKNVKYETPEILRLQDANYNLMVVREKKMILIFDKDQDMGLYMKKILKEFNPDSALSLSYKVERIDSSKTSGGYAFYYSFLPYSRLDIYFDKKTYRINKVIYYYDGDVEGEDYDDEIVSRVVVLNTTYENLPANSLNLFNTGKYIMKNQKDFSPTPAFNDYTVYNNLRNIK